ncbi:MAG: M20/M25/M40 family metallo-hydrolase [Luteitalea sp.]|nr:M20/M25/M40 family metallo-hydrolase [Luteitalea sp.]
MTNLERSLNAYVDTHASRLVEISRDLVSLPSENRAPHGDEASCQRYVADLLRRCGCDPILYTPDEAPGIRSHPLYWPGRDYRNRPNVGARRAGTRHGRSLLLSGHIDTVPVGSAPWTRDPFGGEIDGNRLYGRGANDMKGGIAVNLFVVEALAGMRLELAGDLLFESVVDEEFGGVNGTLAGRLMGFQADAAVISEPSFLRICPAQRGGRTVDLTFHAPNHGILAPDGNDPRVVRQLTTFLAALDDFKRARRQARIHPLYAAAAEPVPVHVTRISTAPWGTSEPTNTPASCRLQLFWHTMPGEDVERIDRQFFEWLDALVAAHPDTFTARPQVDYPIRWLPASAIDVSEPLVTELEAAATALLDERPRIEAIESPCDMYVFHQLGVPAVLWGPSGGNTHSTDEYVEIDSLVRAAKALLGLVCRWCDVIRSA